MALELSGKTDRLNRNQGVRETDVAVAVPLWLPGERSRSAALAHAETVALESRWRAQQLHLAEALREAWWNAQRARIDVDAAEEQLANARSIASDVARRLEAGDLARSDQHQADGAVAVAEAALADAHASMSQAAQRLRALIGPEWQRDAAFGAARITSQAPSEPEPPADVSSIADPRVHPALRDLGDRAAVADRAAALAATRSRANPELVLGTTRERDVGGGPTVQTLTVGVRIPFGAGPRHTASRLAAQADATELQSQFALERERVAAETEAARTRVESARMRLAATERRARLAGESRGFFDKSFRLGETDLPTRLRIEAEAAEALRQAAHGRVELAAAISHWRQALGLLPE